MVILFSGNHKESFHAVTDTCILFVILFNVCQSCVNKMIKCHIHIPN